MRTALPASTTPEVVSEDDRAFITRLDPGPGNGIRLAVKDCIDVAGVVTTAGCPVVAETAKASVRDAACLAGARAAGARIVGKTNLHELCFGATGVNPHYGTPRNPLDPVRIPGGSSSGSAVAVATGQADVALGTDTAGSIRNPAACCGVVGLKTTYGRIPVEGTWPLAPSMDTIGPLARDVAGVIAGMTLLEPGFSAPLDDDKARDDASVRVGRLYLDGVDPRIEAALDAALAATGWRTTSVDLDGWGRAHADGLDLMYAEALAGNRQLFETSGERLGADVRARFERAEQLPPPHLDAVRERRLAWQDELAGALEEVALIVLPGLVGFPPLVDGADPASNLAAVAVSFAGFPALCLPIPTTNGPSTIVGTPFPASLQLVGTPGSEASLCALGSRIESALR